MAATSTSYPDTTITVPMTTLFTPPAECKTHWTYENSKYNSVSNGLLLQNLVNNPSTAIDSACFPSGWAGYGRAYSEQVFSPGACPQGYTTVTQVTASGTTTGVCCYSDFSYFGTISTVNYGGTSAYNFVGCISNFPSGSSTSVPGRKPATSNSFLASTEITGPLTMWAQAITVEFRLNDLALYPVLTSSTSSTTAASSTTPESPTDSSTSSVAPAAAPSSAPAAATSVEATSTATSSDSTQRPSSSSSSSSSSFSSSSSSSFSHSSSSSSSSQTPAGMSTAMKVGIAVAVSLAALALLVAVISFFVLRRRRRAGGRTSEHLQHMDHKPIPLGDGPSRTVSVRPQDHTIHQLAAERDPFELHGSTWHEPYKSSRTESLKSQDRAQERWEPMELYGSTWQKP